jgi:hypothetical protein
MADRDACGFEALTERAGLPSSVAHLLTLARNVNNRMGPRSDARSCRLTVDEVLRLVPAAGNPDLEGAVAFLRRLSAEMAREEARVVAKGMKAAA